MDERGQDLMTRSSSEQTQEIRPSKTQYYNVCKGSYSNGTIYIPDASAKLFVACATENANTLSSVV